MIRIGVSPWPTFRIPILTIFILIPKFLDTLPNFFRGLDLFEPELSVILHGLGLSDGHFDAILFGYGTG